MRKVLALVAVLLFVGCSDKQNTPLSIISMDQAYEQALSYTKSAQIINSLELKAKITATYLNPLYLDRYKNGEYFFVGVYIPNDYGKAKPEDINRSDYKLILQTKDENLTAVNAVVVDKKSHFFKNMPHTDNWSRYYVVQFPKTDAKTYNMTLNLDSEEYGIAKMGFVK